jgi:hypothetical protein
VDDLVTLEDLFLEFLDIRFVHLLDFVVTVEIGFFEVLKLLLKFLELFGDALVFTRYILIFDFVLLVRFDEVLSELAVSVGKVLFFSL